jgi:hypothetical protein
MAKLVARTVGQLLRDIHGLLAQLLLGTSCMAKLARCLLKGVAYIYWHKSCLNIGTSLLAQVLLGGGDRLN